MCKKQIKVWIWTCFFTVTDGASSQDSLWVLKGFKWPVFGRLTVLAIILPQLLSHDFSSFSSIILTSLSKQTILFHLYNLLQAITVLILPSFQIYNSGCCYSTQTLHKESSNEDGWSLQHRNNHATGNSRTCSPTAEDEIKCQSTAEGWVSKFFMSPTFKKIRDPLLPIFN